MEYKAELKIFVTLNDKSKKNCLTNVSTVVLFQQKTTFCKKIIATNLRVTLTTELFNILVFNFYGLTVQLRKRFL